MRDAFRERLQSDTELDDLPDHALLNIIQIPRAAGQSLGVDYPARFLRVAVAHRGVVAGVPG